MKQTQMIALLLVLLILVTACGKSPEDARQELAQMKISFTTDYFVFCAKQGDFIAVDLFLAAKMNPNAKDADGQTALIAAASSGHASIAELLLAKGAYVDAVNDEGKTALMATSEHGHTNTVELLLAKGANVNATNNGWTPLMYAAQEGHTDTVRTLLAKGAEVNAKNRDEHTALRFAANKGHTETALALLGAGASVTTDVLAIANQMDDLRLVQAMFNKLKADMDKGISLENGGPDLLTEAAWSGRVDIVETLLKNRGLSVNAEDSRGFTPLMTASFGGQTQIVNLLLAKGADVNMKGRDGGTALIVAASNGHTNIVRLLLDRGSDVNAGSLNVKVKRQTNTWTKGLEQWFEERKADNAGRFQTALIGATFRGHTDIVKLLLERGADVNTTDQFGRTALSIAMDKGHTDIIELLKGANARR